MRHPQQLTDSRGNFQLTHMALAVIKRQSHDVMALLAGAMKQCEGVHPPGINHNNTLGHDSSCLSDNKMATVGQAGRKPDILPGAFANLLLYQPAAWPVRPCGFACCPGDSYTLQTAHPPVEPPMSAPDTPSFIDFEASSLDLIDSYPIEVGVCLPDGAVHSWLIRPHRQWRDWSLDAEAIHGISRQTLVEKGRTVTQVAGYLNSLLSGPVYLMPGLLTASGCTACSGRPKCSPSFSWSPFPCCWSPPRSNSGLHAVSKLWPSWGYRSIGPPTMPAYSRRPGIG